MLHRVSWRFTNVAPSIRQIDLPNAILLGTAISDEAVRGVLEAKLQDLKRLSSRLLDLDAHDALFLLRNCFAIPKLLYILRTSPCFDCTVLGQYDTQLRETLEILNISMA